MNSILLFVISICWDPSPDIIAGYKVYVDNIYRESVTTARATVGGLEAGRVYGFKVTAFNAEGLESDPSNELRYVMPILTINAATRKVYFQVPRRENWANAEFYLESTSDFVEWRNEVYLIEDETGSVSFAHETMRFYRVRVNIRREGCAQ